MKKVPIKKMTENSLWQTSSSSTPPNGVEGSPFVVEGHGASQPETNPF